MIPQFVYVSAQDLDIECVNAAHTYVPCLVTSTHRNGESDVLTVAYAVTQGGAVTTESVKATNVIDAQEWWVGDPLEVLMTEDDWEIGYPDRTESWEEARLMTRFHSCKSDRVMFA